MGIYRGRHRPDGQRERHRRRFADRGGRVELSGKVGTNLTTKTAGTNHATTFGATTAGTSLTVKSTSAVTETSSNILTVDGLATTTAPSPNVCVNGSCDVEIAAP
jgi:hypothetical protein